MRNIVNRLRKEGEDEVVTISEKDNAPILSITYSKELVRITTYLTTLKRPKDIKIAEFKKFKREALKYSVYRR
jgi:hypothetical protein